MSDTRLVFGFHAVGACLRQAAVEVEEVFIDSARRDARSLDLLAKAKARGVQVHAVDAARIAALVGQVKHQGVVARIRSQASEVTLEDLLAATAQSTLLLVLDGVQDPHNLGACLRIADAFAVQAVIAPKDRAVGLTGTVAKVASGAAERVPYVQVTNLARALAEIKQAGIWVMGATHDASEPIDTARLAGPLAWVLGAEGSGLRRLTREHCDQLLRIPMSGSVESLNVATASGICLYETHRQRRAKAVKL